MSDKCCVSKNRWVLRYADLYDLHDDVAEILREFRKEIRDCIAAAYEGEEREKRLIKVDKFFTR